MTKLYKSLVRPVLDYSGVVYHSLYCKGEEKAPEDLQKKALRIIFGLKETCLEKSSLPTLKQRRLELVDKFKKLYLILDIKIGFQKR